MTVMDRFSVFAFALGDPPPAASELIAAAKHADALGFHSISLPHHLTLPAAQVYTGFPRRDILDPLVLLPAMAAVTKNILVGTNSAIVPVLAPYVWARYFATLDVMSGGRALAGMAMGWFEKDFAAAKANLKRRARHFDEASWAHPPPVDRALRHPLRRDLPNIRDGAGTEAYTTASSSYLDWRAHRVHREGVAACAVPAASKPHRRRDKGNVPPASARAEC